MHNVIMDGMMDSLNLNDIDNSSGENVSVRFSLWTMLV